MPVMSPAELMDFLAEHFPQAAHLGLAIEHLDDRTIRLRLPTHERHLRPGGTISGPTLMWLVDCGFYLLILGHTCLIFKLFRFKNEQFGFISKI